MHPHAWTAATYAEAAGRQGKFWEMHDLLFRTQQQWSFRPANEVSAQFDSYAQQLQLDLDQLKEDIDLREVAQKIRTDQLGGNKAGVRSTPAMFLNGTMINSGISATDLIAKVDEIIVDLN